MNSAKQREADLSPNVATMLWRAAAVHGSRTAIVHQGVTTTYETLAARAGGIAMALRQLGVGPDDRVGILVERCADAAAAFFATAALRGIAVTLNETLRPRQIEQSLEDAGVRVLLTTAEQLSRLTRPLETSVQVVDLASLPLEGDLVPELAVASDAAQIIYTSGSTGKAKGVVISHGNLWSVMHATTGYLGIVATDRIASLLPFSYTYGFNQLLCATGTGAALVIEYAALADQIVTALREQEVTVLAAVPPLWLQLLRVPSFTSEGLPALRVLTNAGGRLPIEAVRGVRRAHPKSQLFLMYGMTETLRATYLSPDEVDARPDSIGRPIPGAEILVLREDGSPCDVGEVGELVQRGSTVGLGYWRDPETTARVFRPNPMRANGLPESERVVFSGDLVRRDQDGFLYHVGRRDKMIKVFGYRVSPDEIVDVLHQSGLVVEAVVTAEPDAQRGAKIIAYVVLATGATYEKIVGFCRMELPRYMQPARIEVRAELQRNASGKHDIAAIACAVVSV